MYAEAKSSKGKAERNPNTGKTAAILVNVKSFEIGGIPFIAETQDEKMYRVVMDRERWFRVVIRIIRLTANRMNYDSNSRKRISSPA